MYDLFPKMLHGTIVYLPYMYHKLKPNGMFTIHLSHPCCCCYSSPMEHLGLQIHKWGNSSFPRIPEGRGIFSHPMSTGPCKKNPNKTIWISWSMGSENGRVFLLGVPRWYFEYFVPWFWSLLYIYLVYIIYISLFNYTCMRVITHLLTIS